MKDNIKKWLSVSFLILVVVVLGVSLLKPPTIEQKTKGLKVQEIKQTEYYALTNSSHDVIEYKFYGHTDIYNLTIIVEERPLKYGEEYQEPKEQTYFIKQLKKGEPYIIMASTLTVVRIEGIILPKDKK